MSENNNDSPDFEKSLAELETLVERMEQGELTLEQSLAHFERGLVLSRSCQAALDQARLKVEQLVNDGESHASEAFDGDSD